MLEITDKKTGYNFKKAIVDKKVHKINFLYEYVKRTIRIFVMVILHFDCATFFFRNVFHCSKGFQKIRINC